ncbi:MAG: patatin-like phospholipase family protein [Fibrobacterota bacterium]
MVRNVLAAAGGGAKGYAQVQVLRALENDMETPLYDKYDLLAGSSVGAIDAAVIAVGTRSMKTYEKNYPFYLKKIFTRNFFSVFGPKYAKDNFAEIWEDIVGRDIRLGEAKTKIIISSVDLLENKNYYFKSWKKEHQNLTFLEVLLKSISAPFYFGYDVDEKNRKIWSDGGAGTANYPLAELKNQIEAFQWYDTPDKSQYKVCMDIVGALYPEKTDTFEKMKQYKNVREILHFINFKEGGMARAQSRNNQLGKICHIARKNKNLMVRYWDRAIPPKMDALDKLKYLDFYKRTGREMAEKPLFSLNI